LRQDGFWGKGKELGGHELAPVANTFQSSRKEIFSTATKIFLTSECPGPGKFKNIPGGYLPAGTIFQTCPGLQGLFSRRKLR
jgi:hypothetical protein